MKLLSADEIRAYLRRSGVSSPQKIDEIVGGFDFTRAVYEQRFERGDVLYQFVRKPSLEDRSPTGGNWFCLPGANRSGLAIFDGCAGRQLHKFRVVSEFVGIEGIAAKKSVNWSWSGGGAGGATQIYVPPSLVQSSVRAVGPHEHW
jgi:hypothetical protein